MQLMNNIVDILNGKFMESRGMRNPNMRKKEESKKEEIPPETEEERW